MAVDIHQIRSQSHPEIGALLQDHSQPITERWARRAAEVQPGARRVHHEVLLNHLPVFLEGMGRSLAAADYEADGWHCPPAREHGGQRWQAGWSIEEVVRDYQLLRLVVTEYLEETLGRTLTGAEVMACGLALDEAIAASVGRYAAHQEDAARLAERERAERQRRAQEAGHRERERVLKEDARRKDDFLALLGHELRNPLAPLKNTLHVLELRGADPPTVAWAHDVAERQVRHLTRLVDDMLDVSRIGRGKILLRRERLDLARLVATIAEDHRPPLESAGLSLNVEIPGGHLWVLGDTVRLTQVVGNLLHNATKFTDPGGTVTLAVSEDGARARVVVRDTGVGIDPEVLPSVFEPFAQAERSRQRSREGLGLGLALVKGLVALHGGEVAAASDGLGRGTTFTVWLPLESESLSAEQAAAGLLPAREILRVLIIEDDRDTAETVRVLLELWDHEVVVAHTGPDGLEAFRHFRPDVVLCDLGLPGMDGYAVARALRAEPSGASVRLIALTGYVSEADRARSRESGFDLHLSKPVDPQELKQLLQRVPEDRGRPTSPEHS